MSNLVARLQRFGRYLLVGGVAWLVDIVIFMLLWPLAGVLTAQILARLLGAIAGFFGHKLWVFERATLNLSVVARQGLAYSAMWLSSLLVSLILLVTLTTGLGLKPFTAKILAEGVVLILNFAVLSRLIFSEVPPGRRAENVGVAKSAAQWGDLPDRSYKCLP